MWYNNSVWAGYGKRNQIGVASKYLTEQDISLLATITKSYIYHAYASF